ncbi:MAG: protein kinase [Pyrinomonadaceae bacterium]|nr:protein kinase [Pyrinomonadaceae bacterium]
MNKEFEANTTLSHYRLVEKIGAGGMGEVYLAEDTKLDRKVALKILPAAVAADQERMRRFVQEAKAAAALNHPNIAHIYEIGEADGTYFIAMEYVEGATLRQMVHRERTPLDKFLRYLAQVAEGLAKAHDAGIVHRDLKPDNVMVTRDGYAKILDFGLAKLLERTKPESAAEMSEAATAMMPAQHSTPGVVMGTVGYMSPEQARGQTIDQRSDIFSFGCILYEAAAGRRAFEGDSVIDTLHKIIYEPAPAIPDLNPSAPAELQRIIRKCLAKEPGKRYQSIRDAANDLEELLEELKGTGEMHRSVAPPSKATTGGAARSTQSGRLAAESTAQISHPPASSAEYLVTEFKRHKIAGLLVILVVAAAVVGVMSYLRARNTEVAIDSLAVLPFVNQTRDPETEYLSEGLAESLIYRLSQLPNLKVSPTSSVFRYKGREIDPREVGNELGVSAVLTGRITQRGDRLTISAELIDVRHNKLLWGEQYDRKTSELLATQREIARQIAENLKLKVSGQERGLAKHYTESNEAYQLYIKGRFYWNKRNAEAFRKAIEYFKQAIEHDPNYALAYAGLADAYVLFPVYAAGSPQESYPKAQAAARKALEIDDTLAEAHTSLAMALVKNDWNFAESNREFQRAIELNPNYATAHQWYGLHYLVATGRFDEAIAEGKRAEQLDPLSLIINTDLGSTYLMARQYDNAIEQFRKALEMDQSFYNAQWRLGTAYAMKGSFQEAIAEYQKARQQNDDPQVLALLAHAYAASGQRYEALRMLDQLKGISKQRYVSAYSFALVYAGLGERDQALQWLEQGYQNRDWQTSHLKVDPMLDNLRPDPRFNDLLRRAGLPQ